VFFIKKIIFNRSRPGFASGWCWAISASLSGFVYALKNETGFRRMPDRTGPGTEASTRLSGLQCWKVSAEI
jgi:hypothetical protein